MNSLPELIPDVDYLLSMEVEELASAVLLMAKKQQQNAGVHQGNYTSSLFGANVSGYTYKNDARRAEIELAISEAWNWLEVQGLLIPASGINGSNGWRVFSRRARALTTSEDVKKFSKSRNVPKASLHPRIAEKVWSAFMRGEFDTAVFQAMRAVEVYVREAGGYTDGDLGVALMRKAFHEDTGPLTDMTVEKSERQARSALFSAAIGSYKNPHSHRDVNIDSPDEALEIVFLANHLLRIVERRVAENSR